jgi:hypothetical protein
MTEENRDRSGRLRVPFFVKLIREFVDERRKYSPDEFKTYVEGLGILTREDRDCESNGYEKWKHRIDRAAQKVFTDV